MVFLLPVLRRYAGSSPTRPLSPRVARQSWTPPAPRSPPSPGPAPVLHWRPSAAMGSEMEPLLLAWSYFRRRKFQLCSDLCTQMLEKSPYDQVPAGPHQPPWIPATRQSALGDAQAPGWRLRGGRPRARLTLRSALAPGAGPLEPWPAGACPLRTRVRRSPRFLCRDRPSSNFGSPFTSGSLKGTLKALPFVLLRNFNHLYSHVNGPLSSLQARYFLKQLHINIKICNFSSSVEIPDLCLLDEMYDPPTSS